MIKAKVNLLVNYVSEFKLVFRLKLCHVYNAIRRHHFWRSRVFGFMFGTCLRFVGELNALNWVEMFRLIKCCNAFDNILRG